MLQRKFKRSVSLKESINATEVSMKKPASELEGSLQLVKPAEKEPLRECDAESLSSHFLPKGKPALKGERNKFEA